jgi:O-acetyl-ADP-ribose deacetylase
MNPKIELIQGDITRMDVDAIVNAANSSLIGGGGVDGAIHRAGGHVILEECMKIVQKQGSCKTGEAVITTGGNLTTRFVIHTVGPVWNGGNKNEAQKLANCYKNSLQLAFDHGLKTVAFPNISTGVYGYPKKEAASVAISSVNDFLQNITAIQKVYFVCFDQENYSLYQSLLK